MRNLLIFILGLALLSSCSNKNDLSEENTTILRPVKYGLVNYSNEYGAHTFSGVAQADQQANLSFRVGGTVRTLDVKLGDRIRKGQLIATIDPTDYSIQAEQASASQKGAEANLKSAETQLIIARSTYQRIEKLYENNSVPLSDFEQAKSNYESAQSQYEASKTQVTSASKQTQSARNQVNYTRLEAPFNGVITMVHVEVNELVGSGNPIAELSSEVNPEVNVGIPESYISQIKKGQDVKISFSVLPQQTFDGKVHEVSYAAGNSPTYPAIIRIINPSEEIRPGMAATVSFYEGGENSLEKELICPIKAIGEDATGNFAFVLEAATDKENGAYTARKQAVKIGDLVDGGFEIKEGLKEGQVVATAGLRSLLDGMKVKLMEE